MRKGQFCWSRMFIHMLADLEKQRIELEKFIEILLTWNIKKRDASSSPQPEPPISKGEFFKEISVDQKNRYKLAFFILNVLHRLQDADGWYSYCEKIIFEKNGIKSRPRWKAGHFQICLIPHIFDDFEKFIDKNRFNVERLSKYYDLIANELIKCFYDCPKATECFLGGEYVFNGHDRNRGEYWRVSLSKSIEYADSMFLAQERGKQKLKGHFPPEKK